MLISEKGKDHSQLMGSMFERRNGKDWIGIWVCSFLQDYVQKD